MPIRGLRKNIISSFISLLYFNRYPNSYSNITRLLRLPRYCIPLSFLLLSFLAFRLWLLLVSFYYQSAFYHYSEQIYILIFYYFLIDSFSYLSIYFNTTILKKILLFQQLVLLVVIRQRSLYWLLIIIFLKVSICRSLVTSSNLLSSTHSQTSSQISMQINNISGSSISPSCNLLSIVSPSYLWSLF